MSCKSLNISLTAHMALGILLSTCLLGLVPEPEGLGGDHVLLLVRDDHQDRSEGGSRLQHGVAARHLLPWLRLQCLQTLQVLQAGLVLLVIDVQHVHLDEQTLDLTLQGGRLLRLSQSEHRILSVGFSL